MRKKAVSRALIFIIGVSFLIPGCERVSRLFSQKTTPAKEKREYYQPEGKVIATIDDMVITLEQLNRYVDSYNQQLEDYKKMYPDQELGLEKVETAEQKIERLKNDLIRQRLLYREALDRRLDKKEDIRTALEEFKMNLLVAALIQEEADKIKVTSEDIQDYYEKNKEKLRQIEERHVREIVTRNRTEANNALVEIIGGADFAEVARKYSISDTASEGGDLGFIGPGTKFPRFDIEVYTRDVGEVSSVFKNPDSEEYYIIKVEGKRGGQPRALTGKLWDEIEFTIQQEREKERIDSLVGKLWSESKIDIRTSEIK